VKPLLQDGYIKDAAVGRMRREYLHEDAGRPVGTRTPDLYRVKVGQLIDSAYFSSKYRF